VWGRPVLRSKHQVAWHVVAQFLAGVGDILRPSVQANINGDAELQEFRDPSAGRVQARSGKGLD
jgi:hypothetical protein